MTEGNEDDDSGDDRPRRSSQPNVTLGRHMGHRVQVGTQRDPPDARAPDEFGANMYIPNPDGENVDIARIDTDHDGCHIDRLYLPVGHPNRREDYSVTVFSPMEAVDYFLEDERWKRSSRSTTRTTAFRSGPRTSRPTRPERYESGDDPLRERELLV